MIYSSLLEEINPQWSVKEKVKYLYEQVCINSYYDDRIDFTEDADLIKRIYYRNVNIDADETDLVVCNTICIILKQLLDRLGIKSRIVKEKPNILSGGLDEEDVALVFYDGEDEYFCNPVGDIQNCKYTIMPKNFGNKKHRFTEAKNVKEITPEENREIDRKIRYIPELEEGQEGDSIDIIPVVELRLTTGPIYYIYSKEDNTYILITYPELIKKINGYKEKLNRKLLIEDSIKEEEER